jgi:hypothetical protein
VGKIGRGVLKRAKSTLDNVEAKVMGVVLNNVKPDAGPDYFRYHSHYYYGPDRSESASQQGAAAGPRFRWPAAAAKASGVLALILALSVFVAGAIWQEVPSYVPAWMQTYAKMLFMN